MIPALDVFDGLSIPSDYASVQKYAVLARSGGGKTYLTAKMLEQMCDAELFFVVLDPVGKHWSLRAGPDGSAEGGKSNVVVLGGLHGDVPLDAQDGALIADVVVEHPGRYILDVSAFESDDEQDRFATAFAKRLFRAKMSHPFPMLLVLEEAEAFVPEQPGRDQADMVRAFARIQKMGRNHGIGLWLVSQRPQDVSKKVLNQTEVLIIKQLAAKLELDAVTGWFKAQGMIEHVADVVANVSAFHPHDAYVSSPSWLRTFQRVTVRPRVTFDSSASARHGDAALDVCLKPLDVAKLAKHLQESREKAKAEDPEELRKEIDILRQRLLVAQDASYEKGYEAGYAKRAELEQPAHVVEVPVLNEGELSELNSAIAHLESVRKMLDGSLTEVAGNVALLHQALDMAREMRGDELDDIETVQSSATTSSFTPYKVSASVVRSVGQETVGIGLAARDILGVLASFPAGLTIAQISLLTGRRPRGGSWNTALRQLKDNKLIVEESDRLQITAGGVAQVPDAKSMSRDEIIAKWQGSFSTPAREILSILLGEPNRDFEILELAEFTGRQPRGGSWNTALKELRDSGLVVGDKRLMKIHPDLYMASV